MNIHRIIENNQIKLIPLQEDDFDDLYNIAKDPLIWEQHPNPDRYKREVFANFFEGALQSKGAFKIVDKTSGEVAGCTRFYDYSANDKSILIGYTFYARKYWGTGFNPAVKRMMLDFIFNYVEKVIFHVGKNNIRSRIAMERIGGIFAEEIKVAYYGEPERINVVYEIKKSDYEKI